jgi:hypothetical protein
MLEQDKFGFRRERGTTDKVEMQRTMSAQSLDVEEEVCTCFIHCLKPFDGLNCAKETPGMWRLGWEIDKDAVLHRY